MQQKFVIIGAGIMSTTLAVLLKKLMPNCAIKIYERLSHAGAESSEALNNAGTGHSGFCELNYTPQKEDGTVDVAKAIRIANQFELSKEFWATLIKESHLKKSEQFITHIPHHSLVWGADNIKFLKTRFETLIQYPLFADMEWSIDENIIANWMPLFFANKNNTEAIAATKMAIGTDVNFGALSNQLLNYVSTLPGVTVYMQHEVQDITKDDNNDWYITIKDLQLHETESVIADFVFIGAGGGTLPLLDKSNIPEAVGYGGFPISGQWLICNNPDIIAQHHCKVYGKAAVGAPPMSVPHLDTRIIDGKKQLLFGPFAGFSTKFLKEGSYLDLPLSIELDNIIPMLGAGVHNITLTKYLIEQVRLKPEDRLKELQQFYPDAILQNWDLATAGQRVQIIKKDKAQGGILEFGTEIVCSADGTLAGLLGASPGASTSVSAMMSVIKKCFATQYETAEWQAIIKQLMPNYFEDFSNKKVVQNSRDYSSDWLFN
jgi:malate dehydrogenase (quinone)